MRNPMKPGGGINPIAVMKGYREITFEELPERIKPDFAEAIKGFAKEGIKMRIYKKPDGSYSLMADPEFF